MTDRGQIPNENSYLFLETSIFIYRICLHLFHQMQKNLKEVNQALTIDLIIFGKVIKLKPTHSAWDTMTGLYTIFFI